MSRALIAMVAGLAVGAVAGAGAMALWSDGPVRTLSVAALARGEPATERGGPRLPSAPDAPLFSAARDEQGAVTTAIPTELAAGVDELLHRAPARDRPRGDKAISGRVVDAKGVPLAGVVLRAVRHGDPVPLRPNLDHMGKAAPPPPTLEETVRHAIADYYESGGEFGETTTGSDGRYRIGELRDGRYSVEAWKSGCILSAAPGPNSGDVRPDATLDWNAREVVAQRVTVELPDGTTAPCATISWRKQGRDDPEGGQGWVAESPELALQAGLFDLRASLGHPTEGPAWPDYLVSEWTKATVAASGGGEPVVLRLVAKPVLRGRLVLSTGGTPPQAVVKAKRLDAGERVDLELMRRNGEGIQSDWVNNGEYHFVELKPGRYVVTVQRFWEAPLLADTTVEIADQTVQHDFTIPELDPATCVAVTVRGPDGSLLPTANFQWKFDRGTNSDWNDCTADRRDIGLWWLPLETARSGDFDPLGNWGADARLYLIVSHEEYGTTAAEIWPTTRQAEVKFNAPATLIVTVPGLVGSDFAGQVNLSLGRIGKGLAAASGGSGGEPNKEEGIARLGPVEAGRWRLAMWVSSGKSHRWSQFEAASVELDLAPGENRASLAIPPLYRFEIRMPEGTEGQLQLELMGGKLANRRWGWGAVEKGGPTPKAVFDDVPAGDYRVTLSGTNAGVMLVRVPGSGTLFDWTPLAINALRIAYQETPGEIVALGLLDGDLITAIDGKAITSHVDLQVMWTLARAQRELALSIVRGDESVVVKVPGSKLSNNGRLGATFEPVSR